MVSKNKALAQALNAVVSAVNDGATPTTHNYFDHVWIGMPKKIPVGDKNVAIIEPYRSPTYYYTTCQAQTGYDLDFYIHVTCKGTVEDANLRVLEVTEALQVALL